MAAQPSIDHLRVIFGNTLSPQAEIRRSGECITRSVFEFAMTFKESHLVSPYLYTQPKMN